MSWILNKFRRIAKFRLDFSGSCQKTGTIEIFLQKIQKQKINHLKNMQKWPQTNSTPQQKRTIKTKSATTYYVVNERP